jgi:eukaryotic-like serine/threonine-protein kinase
MSAPAAAAPGAHIAGKYRVERVLGRGGMAVVLEATHVDIGHRVAVKVLTGDAATAPEVVERFRREARIAAQLPGDHVARVTDVGLTADGAPYLVMELLVGRDLQAELAAVGRLPVDQAVDFVLQACAGVAEAHGAGLVHRDLKPGNLFLTRHRDGRATIKVLDFGISKAPGPVTLTRTDASFGTPLYMSPEQIQSAKHVDARSDQHALAAILYTLVTGRPPFDAPSVGALAVVIAKESPPPARAFRPEVPAGLEAVLARAMSKRPEDRFPDLFQLARALAPFGGPGTASVLPLIDRALRAPRTSPALAPPPPTLPAASGRPTGRTVWVAMAIGTTLALLVLAVLALAASQRG